MDGHLADFAALAVDDQVAFAGGHADVGDVEGDGVADAQARVEGQQREQPVTRARPVLDGAQPPDLGVVAEGFGGGLGQVVAGDAGLAEAEPGVEVVQGGQGIVAVAG